MVTPSFKLCRPVARRLSAFVGFGTSVLLIAACTAGGNPESGEAENGNAPRATAESESGPPAAATSVPLMHLAEQTAFARQDLARQHDVSPDSVTVVNVRPVQWRSGALGCPEQGMSYTDALVPGVQILVKYENDLAAYHAAVGKQPFRCPLDRVETPVYREDSNQL